MELENCRILVTGGAGIIGSHLTEHLCSLDCDVVVADDFSRGHLNKIAHCLDDIELVPVDLTTR